VESRRICPSPWTLYPSPEKRGRVRAGAEQHATSAYATLFSPPPSPRKRGRELFGRQPQPVPHHVDVPTQGIQLVGMG